LRASKDALGEEKVVHEKPVENPKTADQIIQKQPNPVAQTQPTATKVTSQELHFRAVDALTDQPIASKFKLTDNVQESYTGSTNADGAFYDVSVAIQPEPYQLTVTSNGYRTYQEKISLTKPLSAEQSKKTIKLSKSDIYVKINVLDEQTVSALKVATIRVIDMADKRAAVNVRDVPNGQVVATVQPERRYTVEVEAAGYVPYSKVLNEVLPKYSSQNTLNIKMKKFSDVFVSISAVNEATGQRIPAKFKLTAEQTDFSSEIVTTASALVAKFKITDPDIYHVEAVATGYKLSKGNLDAEEIVPGQELNFEAKLIPSSAATPVVAAAPPKVSLVTFNFLVIDASNGKSVPTAKFRVVNQKNKQVISNLKPITNGIQADLPADNYYIVEVEAAGYDKSSLKFEAVSGGRSEFPISLNPVKKPAPTPVAKRVGRPVVNEKIFDNIKAGQSVAIEDNVYFDQSSYILRYEAYPQLNRLAIVMAKDPKIMVQIVGHTDNVGDPRLNLILSENRAKVIANYLINKGINENRITHTGFGQTKPLTNNDTEENKKRNRRVEFLIK
jgi:outer membrane protein OmpA-like peptidoglycan-associated protein